MTYKWAVRADAVTRTSDEMGNRHIWPIVGGTPGQRLHLGVSPRPPGILANLEAPRRPQGNWCDRFRFSQLLMIANSLCDTGEYDDLWTSIHKLNVLRNRLSHEPDQSRFDQALQDLLGFHTPRFFEEHEGEHGIIHSCIVSIYSSLVHLIAETDDQH